MPLGLSKVFIVFIFLSIALAYATNNWKNAFVFMGVFIVFTLLWRFLTR